MKKIILFFCFIIWCSLAVAQPSEVMLVATGEGSTKEVATTNALRSAIEQTYGVFVSANTEILNDELVRDEIATISSGNIQKYNEIACVDLPNGNKEVTLQATVSVSKLVSYAQSKGSECEFAGAVFGANVKQLELNKKNAQKAYEHLIFQLKQTSDRLYSYRLQVSDPKMSGDVSFTVFVTGTDYTSSIGEMVFNTLQAISLDKNQASPILEMGADLFKYRIMYCSPESITYSGWWQPELFEASEPEIVRYFYNELDERLNELLCPRPILTIHDNNGKEYNLSNSIVGTTDPSRVPDNIIGIEQGVVNMNKTRSRPPKLDWGIILTLKNANTNNILYTIQNTLNIPFSELQTISSFTLDAPFQAVDETDISQRDINVDETSELNNVQLEDQRDLVVQHSSPFYHRVKKGETLGSIASKYETTVSAICKLNGISPRIVLSPGKKLRVK